MKMLATLLLLTIAVTAASADTITISSSVAENGVTQTIGNGVQFTSPGGYDFSSQAYASLASITSLSVTMTIYDLDSAPGNQDFNKLTLALGGVDTGLVLNGFRDGQTDTLTLQGVPRDASGNSSTSVGDAIYRRSTVTVATWGEASSQPSIQAVISSQRPPRSKRR